MVHEAIEVYFVGMEYLDLVRASRETAPSYTALAMTWCLGNVPGLTLLHPVTDVGLLSTPISWHRRCQRTNSVDLSSLWKSISLFKAFTRFLRFSFLLQLSN
ncbi:hypothetical protein IG631_22552 [Alternaria alternata]|nr:hypothetical protein IG631_22552 [Alternaria alternata]